jgi:hypothetical protein
MRLLLALVVICCLVLGGCSSFFFGFVSNPGGTTSINGTVIVVSLGYVKDSSGLTTMITAVTFTNSATQATINFCGDQRGKFPRNQLVRADFTTGFVCSTLIAVVLNS